MRLLYTIILLGLMFSITGCTEQVDFTNKEITDEYYLDGTCVVELSASYPYFTEQHGNLNLAIENETKAWFELYGSICDKIIEDCEKSNELVGYKRYIHATYRVNELDNVISVVFNVEWSDFPSNGKQSYEKTFTLYTESNMIFETHSVTRRVYA